MGDWAQLAGWALLNNPLTHLSHRYETTVLRLPVTEAQAREVAPVFVEGVLSCADADGGGS